MSATQDAAARGLGAVEVRSIDYVPLAERHGVPWHLGPVWFAGNTELITFATGLLGVALGLNLFWSLVAIVLGAAVGTFFMAFHSVQGPRLGLPQMIQSRPQFGYLGALIPLAAVVFMYMGFAIFGALLGGEAVTNTTHIGTDASLLLAVALSALLAVLGYDAIHAAQRILTVAFLVVFGILTIGALATLHLPAEQLSTSGFDWKLFLLQFGVTASYQLTWAPYVSDYSRYLPPTTKASTTFWWTYLPSVLGGVWLMALGSFMLAAHPNLAPIETIRATGDHMLGGFGVVAVLMGLTTLVTVNTLNVYGGALTLIAMADAVRPVKPTKGLRIFWMSIFGLAVFLLALTFSESFLTSFQNFLFLILYSLVPWTSVNLVDFYFVRHGQYAIEEIFKPSGIYGRWGWRGLVAYFAGVGAMIPFFSNAIYTGPIATALGGADIALFVGLPVSAILYYVLTRNIDLETERRIAGAERAELEKLAEEHYRPVGLAEAEMEQPLP